MKSFNEHSNQDRQPSTARSSTDTLHEGTAKEGALKSAASHYRTQQRGFSDKIARTKDVGQKIDLLSKQMVSQSNYMTVVLGAVTGIRSLMTKK
ncbi:MAG: hypothetical protein K1562_15765 [Candidatus Thiodiazotropha sp. (ex. Lucinisca nassula)]|nr:hypothetical protein [Candidatus Thiodiazotropha sp. (ex. Lucinisca nassula)]